LVTLQNLDYLIGFPATSIGDMRNVHARMKDVNDLKLNPLRAIAVVLLCEIGPCISGPRHPGGVREPIAMNPRPGE
jgi:hypothetical protein